MEFNSQVKIHLETEAMIHQVTNITELGWKTATDSRPEQLSQEKKLRGNYFTTAKKADGIVIKGIPAAAAWVEENFDKKVLVAVQKAFFQH